MCFELLHGFLTAAAAGGRASTVLGAHATGLALAGLAVAAIVVHRFRRRPPAAPAG